MALIQERRKKDENSRFVLQSQERREYHAPLE
jgi:hypothetical protein